MVGTLECRTLGSEMSQFEAYLKTRFGSDISETPERENCRNAKTAFHVQLIGKIMSTDVTKFLIYDDHIILQLCNTLIWPPVGKSTVVCPL